MVPRSLIRAAASVAAIQGSAHGILVMTATPRRGAAEVAVVEAMRTTQLFAGGLTYWDFYVGYGLIAAAACLVEAVLLWQLARLTAQRAPVRPIIALLVLANVGHALLLIRYFKLPLPIAFDSIITLMLAGAWIALGKPLTTRAAADDSELQPLRCSCPVHSP